MQDMWADESNVLCVNVIGLFKHHSDGVERDLWFHRMLVLGAAPEEAKALGVHAMTIMT